MFGKRSVPTNELNSKTYENRLTSVLRNVKKPVPIANLLPPIISSKCGKYLKVFRINILSLTHYLIFFTLLKLLPIPQNM